MAKYLGWILGGILAVLVIGMPIAEWRLTYVQSKRMRVVSEGKLYRSGQMLADGFRAAHREHQFKSIVNLQDKEIATAEDERDPRLAKSYFVNSKLRESEVAAELGVKFFQLDGAALNTDGTGGRPKLLDDFLAVTDDADNYPMLIHCKAGLHRTGWMTAVWRMEYESWTPLNALEEMRANGFGTFKATDDNDYLKPYIFDYVPGVRAKGAPTPKNPIKRSTPAGLPR